MRNLKGLKLPHWIIKSVKPGNEDEDFTSVIVGVLAFYAVGAIVYFAAAPFGREHIILDVIVALAILAVIIMIDYWLIGQAAKLQKNREETQVSYDLCKESGTEEEKEEAISRLEYLCVQPKDSAKTA